LVLAVVAGFLAWRAITVTHYVEGLDAMPAETLRASWTDWAQVRTMAGGHAVGVAATSREVDRFVQRAYDRGVTSTSAVVSSTYALGRRFGFSPLDASWEMYGQSRQGAVAALAFGDSVDLDRAEQSLERLGYDAPPDGAGTGGVWTGSADLVAQIDATLTPIFENVVVLPDQQMVLLSDSAAYADAAAEVVTGDAPSLVDETDGIPELGDVAGEPVSAVMYASDFACEALGMAVAGEEDQAVAEDLVARAGTVNPLAGLVLAMRRDGSLTVGMHFETAEQAEANLRPRLRLARGEAVGQGGTFAERFSVSVARAEDQQVVLDLKPAEPDEDLLSDLAQGPLVFATC
jgi:hypothetical protein